MGVSAYDALEAHVEKRLSHQFQIGGSYTWSHSLDEQSDIGLFFTGNNPKHLRDSWASSDFDRTHVFTANFQVDVPNAIKEHNFASYFTNDWHLTGIGTLQSGEPWSLYEFYGAVGSINFGNFPTLMNPVLGIKDPKHPKTALTGNPGTVPRFERQLHPLRRSVADRHQLSAPGRTAFQFQRVTIRRISTKRRSIRVSAISSARMLRSVWIFPCARVSESRKRSEFQYELNVFNVTNTTSPDVPQDQAQIRQNNGCSATAIASSAVRTIAANSGASSVMARL